MIDECEPIVERATKRCYTDKREPYFRVTVTDMFGGRFTTRPILDRAASCAVVGGAATPCPEIQYALMDLPNFAIPEVEVDTLPEAVNDGGNTKTTSLYTVQFTDSANSGKQNTLECEVVDDSAVAGAQPKYLAVSACEVYNVGGPEWFDDSGEAIELDVSGTFPDFPALLTKDLILGDVDEANAGTTYEDFQPCSSKGDCDGRYWHLHMQL